MPCSPSIFAIVPRLTSCPEFASAPWVRVWPQDRFSSAIRTMSPCFADLTAILRSPTCEESGPSASCRNLPTFRLARSLAAVIIRIDGGTRYAYVTLVPRAISAGTRESCPRFEPAALGCGCLLLTLITNRYDRPNEVRLTALQIVAPGGETKCDRSKLIL
jgi:hypothetical protein